MIMTITYRVDHNGCGLGSWLGLGGPGAGAAAGRHGGLYAKRRSASKRRCSLHGNNASIRKVVIKQSFDFLLLSGAKRFASRPYEKDRIEQSKPFKPIKFPRYTHGGPWGAKTDALEPLSWLQTTTKPGAGVPTTPRNMADPSSDGVAICSAAPAPQMLPPLAAGARCGFLAWRVTTSD